MTLVGDMAAFSLRRSFRGPAPPSGAALRAPLALAALASLLGMLAAATARAGERGEVLVPAERERLERMERELREARRAIRVLSREVQVLKTVRGLGGWPSWRRPGYAVPAVASGPARTQVAQNPPQQAPPRRGAPQPVDESAERVSGEQERPDLQPATLRQARAVLIGEGRLEIEPSLSFSFTNRNRLDVRGIDIVENVFIGAIEVRNVERNTLTSTVSMRYGLTDRLQFSAAIPYLFSRSKSFLPPTVQREDQLGEDVESSRSSNDLGDITFGLTYHLLQEEGWKPDLTVALDIKTDTGSSPFEVGPNESASGTGFWGAGLGVTLLKIRDPAAIFVNGNYFFHKKESNVGNFDSVDPPDNWGFGFGVSYALNPFVSLTSSFNNRWVEKTKLNGQEIDGSDQRNASIGFGLSYALGRGRSLDVTASFGLTDDSPDYTVTVAMPFRFNPGVPEFIREWQQEWSKALRGW